MDDPEYLKMNKSIFPDDVIAHYAKVARSVTPSEVTQIYLVCDWLWTMAIIWLLFKSGDDGK